MPDKAVDREGVRVILDDVVSDGGSGFKEQQGNVGRSFEWKSADEKNAYISAEARDITVVESFVAWRNAGVKRMGGFRGADG